MSVITLNRHQVTDKIEKWLGVTFNWTNYGRPKQVDHLYAIDRNSSAFATRIIGDSLGLSGEIFAQFGGNIRYTGEGGDSGIVFLCVIGSPYVILINELCRCDGVPPFLDKLGSQPAVSTCGPGCWL